MQDVDQDNALIGLLLLIALLVAIWWITSGDYVRTAMASARYERLEDDGTWYGEIPGFDGVWANAPTRDECRAELEEVLHEWIRLRREKKLPLPDLSQHNVMAA
jgi:predicted RNase H-like HicB family nuclease